MEKKFETLLKLSVPILILLGVTRLTSYYYAFNVNVIQYLDFSEITTYFLNDFSIYLMLLCPLFFFIPLDTPQIKGKVFSVLIATIALSIVNYINGNIVYNGLLLAGAAEVLIITWALSFAKRIKKENWPVEYAFWTGVITAFIALLLITTLIGVSEANAVKKQKIFSGSVVTVGGTDIKSDSSFYFVGKTSHFIFFYNEKENTSTIYPMEKVDKMVYKIKPFYSWFKDHPDMPPGTP